MKETEKQLEYLKRLGCKEHNKTLDKLSVKQASYLIWQYKNKNKEVAING